MPIVLPKEKTPPRRGLEGKPILVYGPPKIGKSTFCAGIPDALFLATEPGLNDVEVFQVPISRWEDLQEATEALLAQDRFRTVVIDTIDNAYVFCSHFICRQHEILHESDLVMGKGWALVRNEFRRVLVRLSAKLGLVMVSHSTEREFDSRSGKYVRVVPSLPGKNAEVAVDMAHAVLYFDHETGKNARGEVEERRVIRTRSSKFYNAGLQGGPQLPDPLPMNWKAFEAAYRERYEEKPAGNGGGASPPTNIPAGTPGKGEEKLAAAAAAGAKAPLGRPLPLPAHLPARRPA